MRLHLPSFLVACLLVGVAIVGGALTRSWWLPFVLPSTPAVAEVNDEPSHGPVVEAQQVKLSPQARANLRLAVRPLQPESYWRTIEVPGLVVDRPAQSDRGVVAPVTAIVTRVHHFPGDTVRSGEPLFTLRLLSEALHTAQAELFKAMQDIKIAEEKYKRLASLAETGTIAKESLIEAESQIRRLRIASQAYRQELLTRGLSPQQIEEIHEGKFVRSVEVAVPAFQGPGNSGDDSSASYELQELKVDLGQQVQAGQTLCLLSNHQSLYIEGRAFRQETPLLEKAAKEGWPVQVEFMEDASSAWPAIEQRFMVRHIANTIDTPSRTFAFYLPLVNQSRSFDKEGKTMILWRYRPGQKVRLEVRVEKLDDVFVLPAEAIVREGPETYVFRQNGEVFERKPVHVVYQDRRHAVIADDGSVPAGQYVAHNGAAQINRALKSGSSGLPPGFHMHADGSIHSNAAHK